jgi:hypothetical protein
MREKKTVFFVTSPHPSPLPEGEGMTKTLCPTLKLVPNSYSLDEIRGPSAQPGRNVFVMKKLASREYLTWRADDGC